MTQTLGGLNKSVGTLASTFNTLKNAFLGYLGVVSGRQLLDFSDTIQLVKTRLIAITGSTDAANTVFDQLAKKADEMHVSIDSLADTYSKLGVALKGTGANSAAVLQVTELLVDTYKLSGKTATEAQSATLALAQSMVQGSLKARQLRSTLADNNYLLGLLKDKYGSDLFKDVGKGAIDTAALFKLLNDQQDKIRTSATNVGLTYSQALEPTLNHIKEAAFNLSQAIGGPQGLASFLDLLEKKIGLISVAIGLLALTQIPALISSLSKLTAAGGALFTTVGLVASLGVGLIALSGSIIVLTFDSIPDFLTTLEDMVGDFLDGVAAVVNFFKAIDDGIVKLLSYVPGIGLATAAFKLLGFTTGKVAEGIKKSADALHDARLGYEAVQATKSPTNSSPSITAPKTTYEEKLKDILGDINKEYLNGTINADQYYAKLKAFDFTKLNRDFRDGKINLEQFNKGILNVQLEKLNDQFKVGATTFTEFDAAVKQNSIAQLDNQLQAGTISLIQYNEQLTKLTDTVSSGTVVAGTSQYLQSIGTVAQGVAGAIKDSFSQLEDAFVSFIRKGKLDFNNFANAILDDLARIVIRAAIIRPLAGAAGDLFSPSADVNGASTSRTTRGGDTLQAAKGAAFSGGTRFFAQGGIVNGATPFSFNGGQRGVMGEAGTEAILPLKRGAGGALGVQASSAPVNVTVNNNHPAADVQTRESTDANGSRQIEILIHQKVKQGIASGQFDKTFQNAYGIKRKGN